MNDNKLEDLNAIPDGYVAISREDLSYCIELIDISIQACNDIIAKEGFTILKNRLTKALEG